MGDRYFTWPIATAALVTLALAGCTTRPAYEGDAAAYVPPQPELPARVRASEIIGRWGYAAYHFS